MKRDLDRIRQILIECEEADECEFAFSDATNSFDAYQIEKMAEAGLVDVRQPISVGIYGTSKTYAEDGFLGYSQPMTLKLTWAGHDYLDSVRDAGIWQETKAAVAETGGNATLEIVKSLAVGFAKKKISQHTGIEI